MSIILLDISCRVSSVYLRVDWRILILSCGTQFSLLFVTLNVLLQCVSFSVGCQLYCQYVWLAVQCHMNTGKFGSLFSFLFVKGFSSCCRMTVIPLSVSCIVSFLADIIGPYIDWVLWFSDCIAPWNIKLYAVCLCIKWLFVLLSVWFIWQYGAV
jgi:hypothetical protein